MIIRKTFWYFVGIIALAFLATWYTGRYSAFPGSRFVFLRLAILGVLLILFNGLWTWISVRKLTLVRKQRLLRLQVGNVFEERFEIENPVKISRLWLEIQDMSNLPGKSGSKVLSRLGSRQDRFYLARTILVQRGAFQLGPTLLRSGDPFGMFLKEKMFPPEKKLLVLPFMESIEFLNQPPGYLTGGRAVRQKSLEVTSYASGVRDYQPGDPLNRIHWRTSAKKDRFMVKEFDQDPQADIWILLDGDAAYKSEALTEKKDQTTPSPNAFWAWKSESAFQLPASTFEYGVSIAASIANYYIKTEKSVGFACADQVMTVIPAEKGERQLGKILETLAFVEGEGTLQVNGLVEAITPQITRGSTVVVISSNSTDDIQVGVELLIRKRLNPVVVLIDRDSFGGVWFNPAIKGYFDYHNIPNACIQYGDSLAESLQNQI